jgi:hypothetical protein
MMRNFLSFLLLMTATVAVSFGQAISSNGGSIQGTVTDPTGAIIPNAVVVVSNSDTGFSRTLATDSAGLYTIGPLNPGTYVVEISAPGFIKQRLTTVVRTGTSTNANEKLTLGSATETVEVNAGALQVNTDQAGVQDVLTKEQVESLPINGRNFLDLAQVQPGVILQSGESFDPTKAGYSAISVDGVSGRTTRILYDGQDITDETVGTTIINVPTGAVDEFQLNRSTQDVSGEVTSTGQVLVASPSGTNTFHGQAFYQFQDHRALYARAFNGFDEPFQRNQFGGSLGGPIIKDKLFFFGDLERIKQDQQNVAQASSVFQSILNQFPAFPTPFRDTFSVGRLDYNGPKGIHFFARGFYEVNADAGNFGNLYQVYTNRDNVPGISGGVDFTTGHFTHSFRGGYEKFHNLIVDDTAGNTAIYNPNIGLNLADGQDGFFAGPNLLAPQGTFQSDKQLRYDGTWTHGNHTVKFGASLNRLLGGGFAAFFSLAPQVGFGPAQLLPQCGNPAISGPCPGDPLNGYSSQGGVVYGNGNGVFTEKPGFGLPGGGVEDWRTGYYLADTWKVKSNFTLIAGLRYSIDTDRANQDLPTATCAQAIAAGYTVPCSGSQPLEAQFNPSFTASHVHQPYGNFGPQAGVVYSPGSHKMSVRAGIGIFYENDIFNNTGNSRPPALNASGPFFGDAEICGGLNSLSAPGGLTITSGTSNGTTLPISTICGLPIGQAAPYLVNIYTQYRGATVANNTSPNGSYFVNPLALSPALGTGGAYGPNYRTPYSIQYNGGVQYEVAKGTIVSADFIHNTTLKVPLLIDENHVGAANTLNKAAAANAIAATIAGCGNPGTLTIDQALIPGGCPNGSGVGSTGAPNGTASIVDFAANGLDSSATYLSGLPAQAVGLTPNTGAAFAGINPVVGEGQFVVPTGQSQYDAFQVVLKQVKNHPAPGIVSANYQVSYSLSRIISNAGFGGSSGAGTADQFFNSQPVDQYDPASYKGRNSNDHTNELSFGGSAQFKYGPQLGLIGHFFSAGATTLTLPTESDPQASGAGEIFRTDTTGDGSTGDLLPGTNVGAYMHQVKPRQLIQVINNYNATQAGTLTPAGQALINAGLLSQGELVALGATKPLLHPAPPNGALPNSAFRTFDASFSYPIKLARFREGMSLVPGITFYNVANLANFGRLSGSLICGGGPQCPTADNTGNNDVAALNGSNNFSTQNGLRTERGSGTFAQGSPRTTEFQLKLNF